MTWQLASFALLAVVVVGGFAWYERERPSARLIALVAALAALAVAGRLVLAPVPNVVATTDIALITGYALGGAPGFAVGALAAPISNIWLGQGPWTVWQMGGWGLTGLLGAGLALAGGRDVGRLGLAVACAAAGFAYGALLDLSVMVTYGGEQSLDRYLALSARGLPFNVAHAAGNFAIALAAGPALVRMIARYRTRLEFTWRPAGVLPSALVAVALAGAALSALSPAGAPARAYASASAASWLVGEQNSDGGFAAVPGGPSNPAMTGWVMLGLEAAGRHPLDVREGGETPVSYLRSQVGRLRSTGDLERTILALAGAGLEPRRFAGHDLVAELRSRRDGDGSVDGQTNLTAFYVLAMRAAGHDSPDLSRSAAWLRRVQGDDGGWGFRPGAPSDPDSTGATVQALAAAASGGKSLEAGLRYLRKAQQRSGGFALSTSGVVNSQSTAWAVQGLVAGGDGGGEVSAALRYLGSLRSSDGHYRYSASSDQTPIWVTAQVLLATERKAFPLAAVARRPSPARASGSDPDAAEPASGANGGSGGGGEAAGAAGAPSESGTQGGAEDAVKRGGDSRPDGKGSGSTESSSADGQAGNASVETSPAGSTVASTDSPGDTPAPTAPASASQPSPQSRPPYLALALGLAALALAGLYLRRRRARP